jgi:hypothetical protein
MDRSLKLLHLVGMALFLGSIAVYIALSSWAKTGGLDRLLSPARSLRSGPPPSPCPGSGWSSRRGSSWGSVSGHGSEPAGCASSSWPAW